MNTFPPVEGHRVLLYGDVDLSIIDGSAIWLVSAATALRLAGADVTVQLKTRPTRETLAGQLRALPGVVVAELAPGVDGPLSAPDAVATLVGLDRREHFDVVVARGFAVCHALVSDGSLVDRLWSYVTDLPRFGDADYARHAQRLQEVASASKVMLAQTESARSFLEIVAPAAAGKTLLIPPMLPDSLFEVEPAREGGPIRLVYAGKLAYEWNPLEILELPSRLAEAGVESHLTVFGDTIPASRPGWKERVLEALDAASADPRITLRGGQSRETVLEDLARQDVGITWRHAGLDSSLEISTKLLEYCAAGVAPVLNRTAAHEVLLGHDYPLFVDDDAVAVLTGVLRSPGALRAAGARARSRVRDHSMSAAATRFAGYLRRHAPARGVTGGTATGRAPLRVVLAGHDFKFASDIVAAVEGDPGLELRLDHWETLRKHDEQVSTELLEWADVVICEWTGPNAIWYATRKRPSQRLITRLHGFEARSTFLADLDVAQVDRMVFVSGFYRDEVVSKMGWSPHFTDVLPNMVDADDFDRPKVPDARFHVGITGIVPALKRLDRVVDLAGVLLEQDPRFVFHVKGRMPWHYPYEWGGRPVQRDAYLRVFEQLRSSDVGERFVFDAFDPAMATWFRRIGFILSPSTFETFHLAPLEGMASGAVPVIWSRPGAREIFGDRWVVDDTADAAARILGLVADPEGHAAAVRDAREASRRYDLEPVTARWRHLVHDVAGG